MIHYLEREWGVHYVMRVTGALVNALVELIRGQGGELHLNSPVEEIIVKSGRATGVRLADGTEHSSDIVISNADVAFTYKHLIKKEHRRKYTDRKSERTRYSMSLFVIYFGTNRRYSDSGLAHHNILLGERYKEWRSDIFYKQKLAEDFSLYLHMPTLTDRSLAPEGPGSFYVLSPVPHLGSQIRSEEHTSELQSRGHLVCRLLLEKKNT